MHHEKEDTKSTKINYGEREREEKYGVWLADKQIYCNSDNNRYFIVVTRSQHPLNLFTRNSEKKLATKLHFGDVPPGCGKLVWFEIQNNMQITTDPNQIRRHVEFYAHVTRWNTKLDIVLHICFSKSIHTLRGYRHSTFVVPAVYLNIKIEMNVFFQYRLLVISYRREYLHENTY